MSDNQRQQQAKQKPTRQRRPPSVSENIGRDDPVAAVQRAKSAAAPPLDPGDILTLQRAMGNKAVQRMLAQRQRPNVQRHWMPNEEQVQFMPLVQRHWMPGEDAVQFKPAGRRLPSSRAFGDGRFTQRYRQAHETRGRQLWGNGSLTDRVQRQDKNGAGEAAPAVKVTMDPVTFAPNEVPADGKTTAQAQVKTSPGGRKLKWEVGGESFGSSVNDAGLVTPGSDTQGKEKVGLQVTATDDETGTSSTGELALWDAKFFQAKIDYPKFIGSAYSFPNFTIGLNGKFDVDYQPAGRAANINVKVKFQFPDDPIPEPSFGNLFGLLINAKDAAAAKARQEAYRDNFMKQIKAQWSGRYQFQNVREPQSIWGKLNPTTVNVNVLEDESSPHFTIIVKQKTKGRASVGGGQVKLFQGSDVPAPAFNPGTAAGELTRVRRNTPSPILFANNSADIPGGDRDKLQFLGTYLSRINNPKFNINIVGHASATGVEKDNQTLSEQRANAVATVLTGAGAGHHTISPSGAGQTGADKTDQWRKVEISSDIPPGWQNMQDVTAHEFGHMLGLGDEYAATGAGPTATHYDLVKKAFGQAYADEVAKRGDTDYASIMEGGSDVRIQHYVTLWSGLCETTLRAPLPDPKFGYDDWKFIG